MFTSNSKVKFKMLVTWAVESEHLPICLGAAEFVAWATAASAQAHQTWGSMLALASRDDASLAPTPKLCSS